MSRRNVTMKKTRDRLSSERKCSKDSLCCSFTCTIWELKWNWQWRYTQIVRLMQSNWHRHSKWLKRNTRFIKRLLMPWHLARPRRSQSLNSGRCSSQLSWFITREYLVAIKLRNRTSRTSCTQLYRIFFKAKRSNHNWKRESIRSLKQTNS